MSRAEILGAIRRGLKRGALAPDQQEMLAGRTALHRRHIIPKRGQLDFAGRVDLFTHYAEREFATVARLESYADIPGAVVNYLAGQNIPPASVVAAHPVLQGVAFAERPMLAVRFGVSGAEDLVSLQMAFAGIAETGTLMMPSGPMRPTTNNLLPDTAIVVLEAKYIVGCYEEAFDELRQAGPWPRNVMLVTGPSRSADIEQTLELGAHGPRRLHILIIDG